MIHGVYLLAIVLRLLFVLIGYIDDVAEWKKHLPLLLKEIVEHTDRLTLIDDISGMAIMKS